MESTGVPELVHISEVTCSFLGDGYIVTEGEEVFGHRTYFVHGKKAEPNSTRTSQADLTAITPSKSTSRLHVDGMQLSKSVTNLSTIGPNGPPASPVGAVSTSLNPSPVMPHRTIRIPSLGIIPTILTTDADENGRLNPTTTTTSTNAPKIALNEQIITEVVVHREDRSFSVPRPPGPSPVTNHSSNSQIESASGSSVKLSSKYSVKFKSWKAMPKFLFRRRTSSDPTTENGGPASKSLFNNNNNNNNNSSNISFNSKKDCDTKKFISKSADRSRAGSSCELMRQRSDQVVVDQNGYQQIPVVLIESDSARVAGITLEIPKMSSPRNPNSTSGTPSQVSPSVYDDIIDIRSYISQSRSDISPFARSGSYRSQGGVSGGGGGMPVIPSASVSHYLYPTTSGAAKSSGGSKVPTQMDSIIVPMGRPRSSTLIPNNTNPLLQPSSHHNTQRHSCCASPYASSRGSIAIDAIKLCPSAPQSRKGSGARSNSRRSSVQQALVNMNNSTWQGPNDRRHQQLQHQQQRASGYLGNSNLSVNNDPNRRYSKANATHPDPLAACLQQLRKQSDLQLIRCVKDNAKSQRSYLVKPPLNKWTLFFKSRQLEREFRSKAHRFGNDDHVATNLSFLNIAAADGLSVEGPPTLATPRYNTYIDIIVGVIIFCTISAALFLLTPSVLNFNYRIWVCLFALFAAIQLFAVFICTKQMCRNRAPPTSSSLSPTRRRYSIEKSCVDGFFDAISNWYPWHFCGGILLFLPVISILVNFALLDVRKLFTFEYYYGFLLFLCIIHFCNFTQLNCWLRNTLAFGAALAFILIILCQFHSITKNDRQVFNMTDTQLNLNHPLVGSSLPGSRATAVSQPFFMPQPPTLLLPPVVSEIRTRPAVLMHLNETKHISQHPVVNTSPGKRYQHPRSQEEEAQLIRKRLLNDVKWLRKYQLEIYIDLLLLLFLVWFLNREYEIGYRLAFYGSAVANQDKVRVQHMKNQADMLLHNIIPKHVAEQLKNTAKYSENHREVGIIFASIVNFNEMYDESYLGGKEYLRVLNELIGDFDELLSRREFKCVEKIKTIGSTFMAASGLDPTHHDTESYRHLVALMDFCIAIQTVVEEFNKDLLEFNLIVRIGYNIGDVTAGVIGTTKLYYDIWGDSVNVASRMDSTGLPGRIQVGASCLPYLQKYFSFEPRGSVYVKGKDNMEVYLLQGKKPLAEDENVDFEEFHNLQ